MLNSIIIALLALSGPAPDLPPLALLRHPSLGSPYVELWTNRDEVLHRGDKLKVYFRTDIDGYVTVFRIDTDGRIRVLFPVDPYDDNYTAGGLRYQVDPAGSGYTFRVDDYPGQGYVFAVASRDPFLYTPYVRGDHWDYRAIAADGRIAGDPYVAVGDVIDAIVPANYMDYAYDIIPYFVEDRYEYPRFLCYECHAYASYPYWNPYAHTCPPYGIVIYDDPYYYPARTYYATRVVYPRPVTPIPRYVFRDRGPDDDYVTTVRERPVDQAGRRRIEPGPTRRDLPGGTMLPTPTARPGVSAEPGRRAAPDAVGQAPEPRVPTLERRDPSKAPTVPPPAGRSGTTAPGARRAPAQTGTPATSGVEQPPAAERRGTPAQTERPTPPRTEARPKTEPKQAPEPRRTVEPQRRETPQTPPKAERSTPPQRAEPPKGETRHSDPPPKRRG